MQRTLVIAALGLAAGTASAQIIQPRHVDRPIAFTSLAIGWFQPRPYCDGGPSACLDFGAAPQWRASLELPMGTGGSFGVAATTARVPLVFHNSVPSTTGCSACEADVNVSQYMATVHLGGMGLGLRQVIELGAGMTVLSNFRTKADGSSLASGNTSNFTFGIGYGIGYGVTQRTELILSQDAALMVHKSTSGSADNSVEQFTLRFGVRIGLGDK